MPLNFSNILQQNAQNAQQKINPLSSALNNVSGININPFGSLSPVKPQVATPATKTAPVTTQSTTQPSSLDSLMAKARTLSAQFPSPSNPQSNPQSSSSNNPSPTEPQNSQQYIAPEYRGANYTGPQSPITGPQIQGTQNIPQSGMGTNQFGQQVPINQIQNVQKTDANGNPIPGQTVQQVGNQGQLINQGATFSQQDSPEVQAARKALLDFQTQAAGIPKIAGAGTGIPLEVQQGQEQILRNQAIGQEQALSNALSSATTAQGQRYGLLNNLISSTAPVQVPYSNQYINPLTGQPVGGGSLGGSLQSAVQNVVQKLTNGQMTYNDAVNALSGYGQGGLNALQQALPQGFNVAQSNTLAGTQGTIKPAFDYAKLAMDNLKASFGGLSVPGQGSNIQPVADVANWFSNLSGIGKEAVRTKEGALAEARSAIQKVLASIQGGTPTDYTGQSHALLPDNATPADVDAAYSNLQTLGQGKVNIYGNPGQSGNQPQNATGNIYSF